MRRLVTTVKVADFVRKIVLLAFFLLTRAPTLRIASLKDGPGGFVVAAEFAAPVCREGFRDKLLGRRRDRDAHNDSGHDGFGLALLARHSYATPPRSGTTFSTGVCP